MNASAKSANESHPLPSLSRDAVRDVDRRAIEEFGMPGLVMMENAGRGTAELLCQYADSGPVAVCAGKGNNGGDGFVIARHLDNRRRPVTVHLFADPDDLHGDAATNFEILRRAQVPIQVWDADWSEDALAAELGQAEWIVDALLGTGTRGSIRAPFDRIIPLVNAAGKPVLAVDLPSGLDCDSGQSLGQCIRARATASFVSRKRGFDEPASSEFTGDVHVIDIGVPRRLLETHPTE